MRTFLLLSLCTLSLCAADPVRFMVYNVRNFLESEQYRDGEITGTKYKPDAEIEALVTVILRHRPQVIGICEIGTREDLAHLCKLLADRGLHYPHQEHVAAADSVRHLALLSQLPIKSTQSYTTLTYQIGPHRFPLRRGLLHVELTAGSHTIHALGVHLKSKRPSEIADESLMRLKEAYLIRDRIDAILKESPPDTKLLLYGDLNDHFRSNPVNVLKGHYHSPFRLTPLDLTDAQGHHWTHYWAQNRLYSTFDYLLCTDALLPHVIMEQSFIDGKPPVLTASDHRPLIVTFQF